MSKNTGLDWGHGALSLYNASQQRKMKAELGRIREAHSEAVMRATRETNYAIAKATNMTLNAIKSVADLQIVTMSGLVEMDKKLDDISQAAWDLNNYFKTKDKAEAFLKGLAIDIEKQVEFIMSYSESCPEYAIIQLEVLKDVIESQGVVPDHYLTLSVEEAKWAANVIQSVDDLHYKISSSLGD